MTNPRQPLFWMCAFLAWTIVACGASGGTSISSDETDPGGDSSASDISDVPVPSACANGEALSFEHIDGFEEAFDGFFEDPDYVGLGPWIGTEIMDIFTDEDGTRYVTVAEGGSNQIMRQSDGTWSFMEGIGSDEFIRLAIRRIDDRLCVCGDEAYGSVLILCENDGEWEPYAGLGGTGEEVNAGMFKKAVSGDNTTILLAMSHIEPEVPIMFRRLGNGSWETELFNGLGPNAVLSNVWIRADDDIYAVGRLDGTHGLMVHYDGVEWGLVPIPDGICELYSVSGNANGIYVVGSVPQDDTASDSKICRTTKGIVLYSEDSASWDTLEAPTGEGTEAIASVVWAWGPQMVLVGSVRSGGFQNMVSVYRAGTLEASYELPFEEAENASFSVYSVTAITSSAGDVLVAVANTDVASPSLFRVACEN